VNEEERNQLKQEIIDEIEEKFKGIAIREDTQGVLSGPRNKWFRDVDNTTKRKQSLMYEAFGPVTYWMVWELIRKLTCIICGCGYVRQLSNREQANEVAELLCQNVYELRKGYSKREAQS
jgi:hypothetical protein